MISGNYNRSPQYATMGPGAHRQQQQHPFAAQQQQQVWFMAGGSVSGFPQMPGSSRRFSMMPNGGQLRPTIAQCDLQHGFGGGYGYSANSGAIFQPHYHQQAHLHNQQRHQQLPPPQLIHHQPPQQYIQQAFISPQPAVSTVPTSGFINGIKNMVKGFIQPLNCDFYSDHHKTYNPKYRNNYMRDIGADVMSFVPQQPEPHVQAVMIGLDMNLKQSGERKSTTNVPKPAPVPRKSSPPPPKTTEVVAIFTSEDFPELPAPRSSRSITPAKTEKTEQQEQPKMDVQNEKKPSAAASPTPPATVATLTLPKSIFFEIKCTTRPCGRRPTFGGRLEVVPPPFTLIKSPRSCRRKSNTTSTTHEDCDNEDDSFEIFPNGRHEECPFTSAFGACRPPRQRQISECSDDSFVVFFAEDADSLVALDDDEEDDDDDDDDGLDSDEDDETSSEEEVDSDIESDEEENNGTDVVDSSHLNRNKTDRSKCIGPTAPLTPELAEHVQFDSGFDDKKVVTFDLQPVVHVMHAWNYAYRAARKGHWEDFARDRTRFQKRIERTSVYLNPILTPEHRERIYRSRFSDDADNQQPSSQQQQ